MQQPTTERLNEDGPMLSETSGEVREGAIYFETYDPDFQQECDQKSEVLNIKMAALRAAGLEHLEALKVEWEQQCDKLHQSLGGKLQRLYEDVQEKGQEVQEGKERLEKAKLIVANLGASMAGQEEAAE